VKVAQAKVKALARKLVKSSIVDGEASPQRVSAVLELMHRRPEGQRKTILQVYLRMMRREEALSTLVIERAGDLDDASRKALIDGMSARSGRKLIVRESENLNLIGGLKVSLGDDVFDASITGMLSRLSTT